MPKLTKTGWEIGSSEAGAIVLTKTAFQNRHEILQRHKLARAGVETVDTFQNKWALKRGNFLEPAISDMAKDRIEDLSGPCEMYEPTIAYKKEDLGIASSIDRILTLSEPLTLSQTDGSPITFSGKGICEIKSDRYHQGRIKPEWAVQVTHQMLCADMDWSVIAVFDQDFKLSLYPIERNTALIDSMMNAYAEFWELVNSGGDYPAELESGQVYHELDPKKLNTDLDKMCEDYMHASFQSREYAKTKAEIRIDIETALETMGHTHVQIGPYRIKSELIRKPKRKMVTTDEVIVSSTFTVKETA